MSDALVRLERLVDDTRRVLDGLDPEELTGPDARVAVERFVALEKCAAAGKLLALGRLDRTGAWVGDGSFRDLPSWLASVGGSTVGAARATSETARRLRELPATTETLRSGALSPAQADAVSGAAQADPSAELELLDQARTSGVKGLRIECDRVIAAATAHEEEIERYERIRADRTLRHRKLADGSGCIDIRGPLDRTALVMAALEPFERTLFEEHRASGRPEHPDATAFDALGRLCASSSSAADAGVPTSGSRPLAMVVVHVSKAAYERGWTGSGERCEIQGAGPVPVAVARRLASDSILRSLVVDGTDVTRVSHLGRTIPARLRTAVEVRDRVCVVGGCEVERHLEIDHNIPVAAGGRTELGNLGRVCHHHHDLKTRGDLRRIGPLGRQRLVTRGEYEQHRQQQRAEGVGRAPPVLARA